MVREDAWVGEWLKSKLIENNKIEDVTVVNGNLLSCAVKKFAAPVSVATISVPEVTRSDVAQVVTLPQVQFLLNLKKDGYFNDQAFYDLRKSSVGCGTMGDFYSAINNKDCRSYLTGDTKFVLRGLEQHTGVSSVQLLNMRKFLISRPLLKDLMVLALNDYDITAEAVRLSIQRYGACNFILKSNPNARASNEAEEAAKNSGTRLLSWAQLLGAVNN